MWPAILTVLGVLVVALLGFFGSRLPTLESQRADFQAIVGPLREELSDLRERVGALETQRKEDKRRFGVAIQFIRELLAFIHSRWPADTPPPVPPELSDEV